MIKYIFYTYSIIYLALFNIDKVSAAFIGDYINGHELPGYIDLNPHSAFYTGTEIPYDEESAVIKGTPSQIIANLLINDRISKEKITTLVNNLKHIEEQAKTLFCQQKLIKKERDNTWCKDKANFQVIEEEWRQDSMALAYKFARERLLKSIEYSHFVTKTTINSIQSRPFLAALFEGLEAYQALLNEDFERSKRAGPLGELRKIRRFVLTKSVIKKDRLHAANLMREDGRFYSKEELDELHQQGYDLSLLNPPDSGFWRNPKNSIARFTTSNYSQLDLPSFKNVLSEKETLALVRPEEVIDVVLSDKIPKGGESPKIDVTYKGVKLKLKFLTNKQAGNPSSDLLVEGAKAFQGSEVNVEPLVNNLAAALGFSVDPTYYKQKIRVYFKNDSSQSENFQINYNKLIKDLETRFDPSWNVASAFNQIKTDEQGLYYIELKGATLETRSNSKSDLNFGSFSRIGLGKDLKREHRGFALFLAWIMDVDTKDANDKIKLIAATDSNGKTVYKLSLSNSDMGASLGIGFPNFFKFNLIKNISRDENGNLKEVELNYRRIYGLETMQAINVDDAKWMARLIGQLSLEQLIDAGRGAGLPDLVAQYYAELLAKKRNELVKALGLSHEIPLLKEFQGSIEGYEQFFKHDLLDDSHNQLFNPVIEPFPRYWGTHFRHFLGNSDTRLWDVLRAGLLQKAIVQAHSSLLQNVSITNKGFSLFPLNGSNSGNNNPLFNGGSGCGSNCFVEGFRVGVNAYVPMRFFIPNPFNDPKFPYWSVDIFRVGAFVGHNGDGINQLLKDSLGKITINGSARFFKMGEYIKIRPIKSAWDLLKELDELGKTPGLAVKKVREHFIEKMQAGDILIHSNYIGSSAQAVLRYPLLPYNIGPSLRVNGDFLTTGRVTVFKENEQSVLTNWGKLKQATSIARLNLIDLFIQLPILEAQFRQLEQIETTFKFNLQNPAEKDLLISKFSSTSPYGIPIPYRLEKRDLSASQRRLMFGLFGLRSFYRYTTKINVDYVNYKTHQHESDISYEKKCLTKRLMNKNLASLENKIKASVNTKDGLYAKINIAEFIPNASKDDFLETYTHYEKILPNNFITFDPHYVSNNFGDFRVNIETIFSDKAFRSIFSKKWSKYQLCLKYAELHLFEGPNDDCEKMRNENEEIINVPGNHPDLQSATLRSFKHLWNEYKKARIKYHELLSLPVHTRQYNKAAKSSLKAIVDMLGDSKNFKYKTMKFFVSLSSREDFYRKASFISRLEAFPGQVYEISENELSRGDFAPTLRMLNPSPEKAFEIFTDKIHAAIGPQMLSFRPEL